MLMVWLTNWSSSVSFLGIRNSIFVPSQNIRKGQPFHGHSYYWVI